MATIFHASVETIFTWMKTNRTVTVQELMRHLDKKAIKKLSANGEMPKHVYVSDERGSSAPNTLIPYNKEYQAMWGNQPIYGNIIFCYGNESSKSYQAVPADKRATAESISL